MGITIAALLMIGLGLLEVAVGFIFGNKFGAAPLFLADYNYQAPVVGSLYALGGILLMTMKRWAAKITLVTLGVDLVARAALVAAGLFPIDSLAPAVAVVTGVLLALGFGLFILSRWPLFEG